MRRICISALTSVLLAGAFSDSASAQVTYVPYGANGQAYGGQVYGGQVYGGQIYGGQGYNRQVYVVQQPVPAAAPVQQYVYTHPAAPAVRPQYAAAPQYVPQQYYVYAPQQRYAAAPQASYQPTAAAPAYTGAIAPRYVAAPQPSYAVAPAYTGTAAPLYAAAASSSIAAPAPAYAAPAAPAYAAPPVTVASSSGGGFLEAIFGGPTIEIQRDPRAPLMPMPPQYQPAPAPQQPAVIAPPAAYAPSSQGGTSSYPVDPRYDRQVVEYRGEEKPGTVIIDTPNKFLFLVGDGHKAVRYGIGVGRPGFTWSGVKEITAMKEWPEWRPPADMLQRRPDLPRYVPGGIGNPLGARAMYLGSSLYRIHGSNEPWTIGTNVSSGCIRMRNDDVTDLYGRVKIGTKVVVI